MGNKRLAWIDNLKIISTFFIVFNHGISSEWVELSSHGGSYYFVINSLFMVSRAAVPIFFMCSGYGMLAKEHDLNSILKKNVLNILISYIGWMIIFGLVSSFSCPTLQTKINCVIKAILFGSFHTWFIFTLVCLYLITPFLYQIVYKTNLLRYFLILSIVFNIVLPYIGKVEALEQIYINITNTNMHFVMSYVLYYVLGFYLATIEITKIRKVISYTTSVVSLCLGAIISYILSLQSGSESQTIYCEFSIIGFLICSSLFFTGRCIWNSSESSSAFTKKWVSLGLGIYLLHPIFNQYLMEYHGYKRLLAIFVVYLISVAINQIISYTPLKKILLNG